MSFTIWGLGTAVPPHRVRQNDALEMSAELLCENERQKRLLRMLFRKAGVETRHTVVPWQMGYEWKKLNQSGNSSKGPTTRERMKLYQDHASPLGQRAAEKALTHAKIDPSEITHLITVSCTGFQAPGVDLQLIRHLGLPATTERVHVGYMGCHGAINGLRVAEAFAACDPRARILLCAVELCSLHFRLSWDDEGVKGNALFADGAAAIVGGACNEPQAFRGRLRQTGSCVLPESADEMSWEIGNYGFEMRMTREVPHVIEKRLKDWMAAWLDRSGYTIHDVGQWAVHPGGPRILDAVESALELPPGSCDLSRQLLRQYGNMSSPTVMFLLEEIFRSHPRFPIVALGFGPGLAAEAALWDAG